MRPAELADHEMTTDASPGLEDAGLDALLREVLARIRDVQEDRTRWQLLLDAVISMAGDLTIDSLLARIVEIAADLAGAEYAALGVLGTGQDRRLETFITHGIGPDQARRIGDLPTGHGLLGLIIDRPEPLRLRDIAAHPESYGFPEHHPPMQSFLGVPIRIREKVFGNLYLTQKVGGSEFTEHDEEIVVALAAAAGVAIENARLHQEGVRREGWLAATAQISASLAAPDEAVNPLQLIVDESRVVAGADLSVVLTSDRGGPLRVRAASGLDADGSEILLGRGVSMARQVMVSGVPVIIEDVGTDEFGVRADESSRSPVLGPAVVVPLRPSEGVNGVLALAWLRSSASRYVDLDAALPATFAEQASLALQLARARDDRQRLALYEDRDRIARDLHDLVIQRLFAVGLRLQGLGPMTDRPEEVIARVDQAVDDLDETIRDIRRTIFALGVAEGSRDVQSEVTRVVDRAAEMLKFRPEVVFDGPVRTLIDADLTGDLLAVLHEALSNVSKHARATSVSVVLSAAEDVTLTIADDGRGFRDDVVESGLQNMRRRAAARGGVCRLDTAPDAGTRLTWSVPLPDHPEDSAR